MSAPPYMKLYWGDYHKATRHLRRDQHGAYFLLIGEAWRLGGTLPDDDGLLAAWALCTVEEWAAMKTVIMAFFDLRRGKWVHDRVREELSSYESTSRKRKEAGRLGGNAKRGKDTENLEAIATQKPIKPEPEPEPKKDSEDAIASFVPRGDVPQAFDLWNTLAKRVGLPQAKSLTADRKKHIKARLADGGIEGWREALRGVEQSRHCRGENDRGWKADLDFVCQPKSYQRLREGSYGTDAGPAQGALAIEVAKFAGPPALRAAVVAAKDEKFAVGYLDPCGWQEVPFRAVVARNDFVAGEIVKAIGPQLDRASVRVIVAEQRTG